MSDAPLRISIDAEGALRALERQMARMPAAVDRARKRALRKLSTWVQRQILREAASAAGVTQKLMRTLVRYRATRTDDQLSIWIGTNPLKAHHLGTVRWTRRMAGARVGRRLFAGSWSWPDGKTGGLVMERSSDARLPIDVVTIPIHDAVLRRIEQIKPDVDRRFQTLLMQELNYALRVEAAP